jgi:hypothetical protein
MRKVEEFGQCLLGRAGVFRIVSFHGVGRLLARANSLGLGSTVDG